MGKIAGAAIGAAGDVASAGIQTSASIVNTNNTNKTNLQIAQETNKTNAANVAATNQANKDIAQMANEHNEAMLEKQIQQEWNMWNAENDYNSPAAQMQRFQDAGVNPYMAMGNVSSGNASSMSSPAAQPAVVPTMQAAQAQGATMMPADMSGLSGLRGVARNFIDLMSAQEDIKGKQLDNQGKEIEINYKADMFMAELYKKMQDAGLSHSKRVGQDILNQFQPDMLSSELRQRKTDTMFRGLQAQGQLIKNLSDLEWYKVLPTQIQQAITQKAVEINNMRLMGDLTKAQVNTEINKAVTEFMKGAREQQNFQFEADSYDDRLQMIKTDLARAINNSGPDNPWQWYHSKIYPFDPFDKDGHPVPWFGHGDGNVYIPGLIW